MTRFGVQLHGTFEMRAYPELARAVERHPFEELTVHDVIWWRPVWPILTLIGASTERVTVGPDVTHPLLVHPIVTAASVAALDELTGGRAVLGVGRGSLLEPLGIPPAPPEAVRRMVEDVQRHLGGFSWQPPRPRVPVFVGTFGPRMLELACQGWADEIRMPAVWDTRFFEDARRRVAGRVRMACDVFTVVDRDRERARDLARTVLGRVLPAMGGMTAFHGVDPGERPISDRTLDLFAAAGTPADVARGVERLVAAGVPGITFSGRLGHDPLWAIGELGAILSA